MTAVDLDACMVEARTQVVGAFASNARVEFVEREAPGRGTVLTVDGADVLGQIVSWQNGYVEVTVLDTVSGEEALCHTLVVLTESEFLDVLDGFVRALLRARRTGDARGSHGAE
jgi:hypothetical protein